MAFGHQKRLIQTDTQQRQWKIVIMVLPLASDYMGTNPTSLSYDL